MHFSAGKRIFLQEKAFFFRKVRFSTAKKASFCRKVHDSAVCSVGLRIMNGGFGLGMKSVNHALGIML